jgi:outer membrane protein assembly factor BamE (lipoprotein component of BamABCDE complex)
LDLNSINIEDDRGPILSSAGVDSATPVDKVDPITWAEVSTISTERIQRSIATARSRSAWSLAVSLALCSVAGCSPSVDQRGNLPEQDKLSQIQPGTTTRDQVVKILGTPSSTGVFDDKSWFYVSRKTKQLAFFSPDVLDQQVYIVRFDGNGVVASVDHKGLQDGREIEPVPCATPAPGRELTFIEQVLGNLGRFNKGGSTSSSEPEAKAPGPNPNSDR